MVRASRHFLFLTGLALLTSACGLKGPLYLPQERAKQQAESEQQKKDRASNASGAPSSATPVPTDTTPPPASTTAPPPPRN
jgi:predicted small lipoprotein YifL